MTQEWFQKPWHCGHNDPVYTGKTSQECAVCCAVRFKPGLSNAKKAAAYYAGDLAYNVDRDTVMIDRGDDHDKVEKAADEIATALDGATVTSNGYVWIVWYKRQPTDLGDYNNPASKWHY